MKKIILYFSLLVLLTGCPATTGNLITYGSSGTRYATHELKGNERGNILLVPAKKGLEDDLIYKNYSKAVSQYLINNGLTVVTDEKDLKYVVFLNYGFVSSRSISMNRTLKIGNKTIEFNPEDYTTGTPQGFVVRNAYGIALRTIYDRVIELTMYDVSKDKPTQIAQMKVISKGQCGQISQLTNILVPLLMENYPPKNGEAEKITNWEIKVNEC
jgi:hypothetical protein